MRLSWISNSPWSSTGYGNQTRVFTPRIRELGHELAIISFWGLEGAPLHWNGIKVYPRGFHLYGQDVMAAHSAHWQADAMISLMDSWVIQPGMMGNARWVPWFPIDHDPLPPIIAEKVSKAHTRIVFSKFGQRMMEQAGLDCEYVPHGVETDVFKPLDMVESRKALGFPQDAFIIGMVAANKGNPSRKSFTQQLAAFAEFKQRHPDAMLYLHTLKSEHGEADGVNLPELCRHLGLSTADLYPSGENRADVMFCDQYTYLLSFPDAYMSKLYSAFDVHSLVSMGEGFGIPILEAQACGCPVVVGDWTSMPELCFSGWKVSRQDAEPYWTPLASYQFIPHVGAILEAYEAAYNMRGNADYRQRARDGALPYDADKVTAKYWKPTLEKLAASLADSSPVPFSQAVKA